MIQTWLIISFISCYLHCNCLSQQPLHRGVYVIFLSQIHEAKYKTALSQDTSNRMVNLSLYVQVADSETSRAISNKNLSGSRYRQSRRLLTITITITSAYFSCWLPNQIVYTLARCLSSKQQIYG